MISLNETLIYSENVEFNIAYGKVEKINPNEVEEAAKFAGFHEKVIASQYGYKTLLDSKTSKFAEEDLLRLIIARIYLNNPKFLLIDKVGRYLFCISIIHFLI